ncbi:ATP/GTP-binding protein [Vibrio splendidus]
MIVDFTVTNFTSLKEEQLFSMYAEKDYDLHGDNLFFHKDDFAVLRTSGILGANASGKSNLFKAFRTLEKIVTTSYRHEEGDEIPWYKPYALCEFLSQSPIKMELEFIVKEKRYIYSIVFDQYNIQEESLYFYPSAKPAKIFHRHSPDNWKDEDGLSLGGYLKGGKRRHAFFANNAYLSVAGSSAESPEDIREVFQYFKRDWSYLNSQSTPHILKWEQDDKAVRAMKSIMCGVDLGVSGFKFKDKKLNKNITDSLADIPEEIREKLVESFSKEISFAHANEQGGDTFFDLDDESLGTKRLSNVMPMLLLALKSGGVLFCDEIEQSFHAHVVELIIKIFNDPTVNLNNAQLIFTTHNIQVMKAKTMRKDQLWLTEKRNGATSFTSLQDFDSSLRDNSPFDKWYAEGRLGGIPSLDYYDISKGVRRAVRPEDYA